MRSRFPIALLLCVSACAQTIDVGSGAPTPAIQELFLEAWARNGFNLLVALPPLGNVKKFGTAGYVQEFQQALQSTSAKLAIVYNPNLNAAFQEPAAMYAFYNTTTPATAGYPTIDTTNCPALITSQDSNNSCQYQFFDNNYALFTYSALLLLTSQTFSIADPYYTKWVAFGGVAANNGFALGPPLTAQTAVTSSFSSKATVQTYDRGAIYSITSGTLSGRLLAVKEPIYDLYVVNGLQGGLLGLPATEELILPNGMKQQLFEGGAIEYDPATLVPVLLAPVGSVSIQPSSSARLNLGDTLTVTATVTSKLGVILTDRAVIWNTTNGNVAQIASASGLTATIKGAGGGIASITATSGGKTSAPLSVTVTAPCCQVGEGAPAALQSAFQDAVLRDKLNIALPAASAALRVGNGYIQQLQSTDATPVPYLVAVPDGSSTGYVVAGAILSSYLSLGGPSGSLGYPTADATSSMVTAGHQIFQYGVLAGLPVQLVNGDILTKWSSIGFEGGVAGSPTGAAAGFLTFRATSGMSQSFQNAMILTHTSGSLTGSSFAVTGLILAQYIAAGAASGNLGAPISDEYNAASGRRQDFEGGYATYAPGDLSANVVISPRVPVVTATPSSVLSGSFVHLTVGGFDNNTSVRVSITGQPDFLATLSGGAYAWDVYVPPGASSGTIVVRAVSGTHAAQASYAIRAASSVALTLSVSSGDSQTGAPGAVLAMPLTVVLKDSLGNAAPGQVVTFTASPGAQLVSASTLTDASGQASAVVRLPSSESLALVTAQAAHQVVTFSARAAAFSLTNFPALSQAVAGTLGYGTDTIRAKGSLLTAAASIILYHQSRGELSSRNGLADPLALNAFLQLGDGFVSLSGSTEQTVNLWRVGAFVAGNIDVSIEQPDLNTVRALVAAGSPVLLALAISGNQGSHFVVATGIAADGSLLISDPDPSFGRTNLNDYLSGLATLAGAVRLLPRAPAFPGFVVVSDSSVQLSSVAGICGTTLAFPGIAAIASAAPSTVPGTLYFRPCAGTSSVYELDGSGAGFLDDLTTAGTHIALPGSSAAQQIAGSAGAWTISPLATVLFNGGIVNAATLTADLAPGGIISIFGAGLALSSVKINGEAAKILAAFPFQINAQIPFDMAPGAATVDVTSAAGSASMQVTIAPVAPEIFVLSTILSFTQAAITNQDNSVNAPSNPALRGTFIVIYGTGFGAVGSSGGLNPAKTPISVVIGGTQLAPAFAGLTPGAIGLYQANVALPATLAPGLALPLYLKQGTATSKTVTVAVQ